MLFAFKMRFNPTHEEIMKLALFALVTAAFVTAPALADQALAASKNCMAEPRAIELFAGRS